MTNGGNSRKFFHRKGRYSLNLQLIGDDKRRIIYFRIGETGSCYDSDALDQTYLHAHPEEFFALLEYILGDNGYGGKWWLCTPYKNPVAQIHHNRIFNQLFSSGRVTIEHLNGILKNRWASLKGIPKQVNKKEHLKDVAQWIMACLTLHNMLIAFNDEWEEEDPPEDTEQDAEAFHATIPEQLIAPTADGVTLRARVQAHLLHWFYEGH